MASAQLLQGLMKWLARDEWRGQFASVLDDHLLPACRQTGQDTEEAIAILQSLVQQPNIRSAEKLGLLAYAYARGGHAAQARATLKRLPSDTTLSTGAAVAAALDALGDRDAAVAEFRRAVAQHEPWLFIHDRATPYDGLRKDPRLASVFAKIEATR